MVVEDEDDDGDDVLYGEREKRHHKYNVEAMMSDESGNIFKNFKKISQKSLSQH